MAALEAPLFLNDQPSSLVGLRFGLRPCRSSKQCGQIPFLLFCGYFAYLCAQAIVCGQWRTDCQRGSDCGNSHFPVHLSEAVAAISLERCALSGFGYRPVEFMHHAGPYFLVRIVHNIVGTYTGKMRRDDGNHHRNRLLPITLSKVDLYCV